MELSIFVPVQPTPASRPRVTRWGTYHAKPYQNYLKELAKHLTKYPDDAPLIPPDAHIRVTKLHFIIRKAKTSKLTRPKGDIDNYVKAIFDGITHSGLWADDVQIVEMCDVVKRFAEPTEQEGTLIQISYS